MKSKTTLLFFPAASFAIWSCSGGTDFASQSKSKSQAPSTSTSTSAATDLDDKPTPQVQETAAQSTPIPVDAPEPECGEGTPGFVGAVYQLETDTAALPDFKSMTPIGKVTALNLDVPVRDWDKGFPGVENLNEWFAISFSGIIQIPEDGEYVFRLNSDDGSKLYLNDTLVLDHDGLHASSSKDSVAESIKKGKYSIRVDWYQGPPKGIALQLFWKRPGASDFTIVPADHLEHARDCALKDLGTFP